MKIQTRIIGVAVALAVFVVATTGCYVADPLPEPLFVSSVQRSEGYWHEYDLAASSASPGASGATLIDPSVDTLGGYRLDAIGETLRATAHIDSDFVIAGLGAVEHVEVEFEVNVDNTGGLVTDVVVLTIVCYHKNHGFDAVAITTHTETLIVGQCPQYRQFEAIIPINGISADQTITFLLNLDTVASDVTNIIVNNIEFKYPTLYPAEEK